MKIYHFVVEKPARFFFLAAIIWGCLMCIFNTNDGANFQWHDILVEANGMFFDLLVFGVLLSVYEALREKKEKIERLHEEIDDYREWPEKEAKFRTMGAVRRLVKEGAKKLNLRNCYLEGSKFANWDLSTTHFDMAILVKAKFYQTKLIGATFQGVNFDGAEFHGADLNNADLSDTDLSGAKFSRGTNLTNAILKNSRVLMVGLYFLGDTNQKQYPYRSDSWFRMLEKEGVIGWEEIESKYFVDGYGMLQLK